MLKGIPDTFTPELMKLLMELGHGEQLLICDGNFPYKSRNKDTVFILNIGIDVLLDQILEFFPLDHAVEQPAMVMEGAFKSDTAKTYAKVINQYKTGKRIESIERFAFYDRSDQVAGIIVTNDKTKFGNIIIQKGVVI